jgi:NAD(P)-dependent dehydrogenase (short-subunit alcohol dehydrogenase family)
MNLDVPRVSGEDLVTRFEGRTVLVTGAGVGGMGRATAQQFAREGANVVVADIDLEAAHAAAGEIRAIGGRATPYRVDLRDRNQVFQMVDQVVDEFGGLDVLANVAGIYPHSRLAEMSEEFWNNVLGVDLNGPLFTCQAALRHMATKGGVIVNVASGAAFYAIEGLAAYSAAKGGLVAMSRVLALEGRPNVRVNTVIPGSTAHPGRNSAPDTQGVSIDAPPTERMLMPSEVAEVVVWCSSPDAAGLSGALLRVGARQML